mgnify:FL=1
MDEGVCVGDIVSDGCNKHVKLSWRRLFPNFEHPT